MKDVMRLTVPVDLGDGTSPIVMVDDERLDFELALRFHRRSGLANPFVHHADGESFLNALEGTRTSGRPMPALVLMDINMPLMNGFEVVGRMRGNRSFRHIPVVSMLTSSSDPYDRERAREIGADSYLIKPFDPRAYADFFATLAGP